jgi:hypothetical protein
MKLARLSLIINGVFVFTAINLTSPCLSSAQTGWLAREKIKLLNKASTELKESHPDISAALKEYADDKTLELRTARKEKGKFTEERIAKHKGHIILLRNSAEALAALDPELAKRLKIMADKQEEWLMKNLKGLKKE